MNNIEKANEEIQEVLKKYHVKVDQSIEFPVYRILPDEIQLALNILKKHGMKIVFFLKDLQ